MCSGCGDRSSVTAGTIFDRTRTPLTVWFNACWLVATGKDGISALSLKRTVEIGSYQTAWAMLHRLRSVLVRPGRERLVGTVEVDETYVGGLESGLPGGRASGKKVVTGIAVEIRDPRGYGRCRMLPLADALAASLPPFVTDHVEPLLRRLMPLSYVANRSGLRFTFRVRPLRGASHALFAAWRCYTEGLRNPCSAIRFRAYSPCTLVRRGKGSRDLFLNPPHPRNSSLTRLCALPGNK